MLDTGTAALLISGLTLIYTLYKSAEERRRWKSLNLPRFVVRNLQLATWTDVTQDDLLRTDWGYSDAFAVPLVDKDAQTDVSRLRVPTQVVAVSSGNVKVSGVFAKTVSELTQKLQERNLNHKAYEYRKSYRVIFAIENVGATVAESVGIKANLTVDNSTVPALNAALIPTLQPAEPSWSFFDWTIPLDQPFPATVLIAISIQYRDSDKALHEATFDYKYDRTVGSFQRA